MCGSFLSDLAQTAAVLMLTLEFVFEVSFQKSLDASHFLQERL